MRSAPYLAVVRRGNTLTYNFLKEQFESQGLMQVIWDRRIEKRRSTRRAVAPERRGRARRRPLPATWDTLGFVLIRRAGR
jgi:hypothetical protein